MSNNKASGAKGEDASNDTKHKAERIAPPSAHPDDTAVDAFAQAMKDKLAAARAKGRDGWQGCSPNNLSRMLREHVDKGDPRDVANFCMFLWHMGAAIAKPTGQVQPEAAIPTPIQQQATPSEWVERAMSLADFAAREAYRAGDYADSSYTKSSHETLRVLRAHLESREAEFQLLEKDIAEFREAIAIANERMDRHEALVEQLAEALEAVNAMHKRYSDRVGAVDNWARTLEQQVSAALAAHQQHVATQEKER